MKKTLSILVLALALGACTAAQVKTAEQLIVDNAPKASAVGCTAIAGTLQASERAQVCTNLTVCAQPFCATPATGGAAVK